MKKILFTGGGTAGHVTANIALIPRFLGTDGPLSISGPRMVLKSN